MIAQTSNPIEVYAKLHRGEITPSEAADQLEPPMPPPPEFPPWMPRWAQYIVLVVVAFVLAPFWTIRNHG